MRGNVTAIIQNMTLECSRETPTFLFNRIYGDPAPGCQKDLRITYCSADAPNVLKEIYVEAEAFGKTISLNPY